MAGPRVAILDGVRSPFIKAGGRMRGVPADDLGAVVVRELLARGPITSADVGEVIFGNVGQPAHAANVARVIALKAGLPQDLVCHTVHHNCASGLQSITTAAQRIQSGDVQLAIAGGTESMSQVPLLLDQRLAMLLLDLSRSKSLFKRIRTLARLRPALLRPVPALMLGLTDPVCGLNMGQTAEVLAREFGIGRMEQDAFALESHRRAVAAAEAGRLAEEIISVIGPPDWSVALSADDGPRPNQSMEALQKLKPYFDRQAGTVTAGNSCPVTDGAAAVVLSSEEKAGSLGMKPLGFITGWAYAALDGKRMGLGPAHATARLLDHMGIGLDSFELIEMNEAFAAQVLANVRAFASPRFASEHLNRSAALGEIDPERLNVNGGAIALGHPVGCTGTRLVITLLRELRRRGLKRGLATLCVGGGQGAAVAVEVA